MKFDREGKITGAEFKIAVAKIPDDMDVPYSESVVPKTVADGEPPSDITYRRYVIWDSNSEIKE